MVFPGPKSEEERERERVASQLAFCSSRSEFLRVEEAGPAHLFRLPFSLMARNSLLIVGSGSSGPKPSKRKLFND